MEDFHQGQNHLSGIFPDNSAINVQPEAEPEQYYAVSTKDEADRQFDIILRTGTEYSFHYSRLLPFYRLMGNNNICIFTYGINISISGRNLRPLYEAFKKQKTAWVKESYSGTDSGETNVFISNIEITGDTIDNL